MPICNNSGWTTSSKNQYTAYSALIISVMTWVHSRESKLVYSSSIYTFASLLPYYIYLAISIPVLWALRPQYWKNPPSFPQSHPTHLSLLTYVVCSPQLSNFCKSCTSNNPHWNLKVVIFLTQGYSTTRKNNFAELLGYLQFRTDRKQQKGEEEGKGPKVLSERSLVIISRNVHIKRVFQPSTSMTTVCL